MQRKTLLAVAVLLAYAPLAAQTRAKRPITVDDLQRLERISDVEISPDGKSAVYQVTTPDLDANRNAMNLWMVRFDDGAATQLTRSGRDRRATWSPDGKTLAFVSARSGTAQVYLLPLDGGEAHALTHLSTDVDFVKWSPDGKFVAFTSSVYPDCADDACNGKRAADREKSKVQARTYDHLLFRHWNHWSDGTRSHLFIAAADGSETPRDLTRGAAYDVPPDERGGPEDVNFSADSRELAFVAVRDKVEATSTNADVCTVAAAGGEPKCVTTNTGFDSNPVYSPDGRFIAYRAQLTAGYEADRWRLMLYDRRAGTHTNLTDRFDRSVANIAWTSDSQHLLFIAEDEGLQPVFSMPPRAGQPQKIVGGFNGAVSISADGRRMAFTRSSLAAPADVFAADTDGSNLRQVTHQNDARLKSIEMRPAEMFWFTGAGGTRVQAILIPPPGLDPSKKYPLVAKLHGGPQTMQSDSWGYRWNEQVFAAPGYAVLLINRRGSTGFGQKFTDDITDDWGGKAYDDQMKGIDAALAKYPYLDGTRLAAVGGSYGGYLANWIATHTSRFKAIISHAGVWDKYSMYGSTEELWFEEHDMKGTPWANPESYRMWSPLTFAADLERFRTPTLVIAGEQDYRVPYTQSLEFFTALQRHGIPSKLLVFPDEGHWISKPLNAQLWYKTFMDWLATYLANGTRPSQNGM